MVCIDAAQFDTHEVERIAAFVVVQDCAAVVLRVSMRGSRNSLGPSSFTSGPQLSGVPPYSTSKAHGRCGVLQDSFEREAKARHRTAVVFENVDRFVRREPHDLTNAIDALRIDDAHGWCFLINDLAEVCGRIALQGLLRGVRDDVATRSSLQQSADERNHQAQELGHIEQQIRCRRIHGVTVANVSVRLTSMSAEPEICALPCV